MEEEVGETHFGRGPEEKVNSFKSEPFPHGLSVLGRIVPPLLYPTLEMVSTMERVQRL